LSYVNSGILQYRSAGDCKHTEIYVNSETVTMLVMCQHTFNILLI